jgi:TRAP-type C4-dicarboxylate transport system permease small subunit
MFHMNRLAKALRRKALAIVLWLLFIGRTLLMLKASTDPLPSSLQGTAIEGLFSQLSTGNQITFDLAVGFIGGLFVYVLVVWLPEQFKRNRIRRNLA